MERKVILHLFEMLLCLYDRSNVIKDILEALLCKMSGPAALPLLFSARYSMPPYLAQCDTTGHTGCPTSSPLCYLHMVFLIHCLKNK